MGLLSEMDGSLTDGMYFSQGHTGFGADFDQKVKIEVLPDADENAASSRWALTPKIVVGIQSDF